MLAHAGDEEERKRQIKNALTLAKLTWQPRLYDPNLRKWLHRIDVPTLIVWGDSDKIIPPAYGPAYRDLIPGAKLEVIKTAATCRRSRKPDELVACITAFIDGGEAMKFYMIHLMPYAPTSISTTTRSTTRPG